MPPEPGIVVYVQLAHIQQNYSKSPSYCTKKEGDKYLPYVADGTVDSTANHSSNAVIIFERFSQGLGNSNYHNYGLVK